MLQRINAIINTRLSVLDSVVFNENVQTEGITEHTVEVRLLVDSTNTEVVLESTTMVHDTARPAMETETTVPTQEPNSDKDNGDNVHSTQRVFIDLTSKRAVIFITKSMLF